jgi:hypothetical protein
VQRARHRARPGTPSPASAVLWQREILQFRAQGSGAAQRIRRKPGRDRTRRRIDQCHARAQHAHDRHLFVFQWPASRRLAAIGPPDHEGVSLYRYTVLPVALVISVELSPSLLAIKRDEQFLLAPFQRSQAQIGRSGDHAPAGRTR